MKQKTYDQASYTLAEHFMQDCPKGTTDQEKKDDTHALAQVIQQAVEDWFQEKYGY
jgi:hypothetical protein